jgi:Uma2 family endonuclease
MSTLPNRGITEEQYLELDRKAERKSEYYRGEMFAMAGAGEAHNLIVANLIASLHAQFRSKPCRSYPSDMRVRVSPTGLYAYPDLTAVCGEPQFLDRRRDTLLNPTLIVEVLSRSTERYDRSRKFDHYASIDSLREYVLVSSDRVSIEVFTRPAEGRWLFAKALRLEETIELESIGSRLSLANVYERVEFPLDEAEARA